MGTVDLSLEISRLLCYGLQKGLLAPEDAAYSANRILALLGISEFEWKPVEEKSPFPCGTFGTHLRLGRGTESYRSGHFGRERDFVRYGSDELPDAPVLPRWFSRFYGLL